MQQEKKLKDKVYIPKVYKEYSSKRVLVCEWVDGVQLTDTQKLKSHGIDYVEAMKISVEAFASQIFRSGFVHGIYHITEQKRHKVLTDLHNRRSTSRERISTKKPTS